MVKEELKYSVQVTGPALSFLYFASTSSKNTQEGFLFGEVEECQKEFISDAEDDGIKNETIIRITGVFPKNEAIAPFYKNDGTIDRSVFEKIYPKQSHNSVIQHNFITIVSFKFIYIFYRMLNSLDGSPVGNILT